jgi:enoyl-CoA hydratase
MLAQDETRATTSWPGGVAARCEVTEGVLEITLCRPDTQNRLDEALRSELTEIFRSLRDNTEVRAVILAAEGDVFSAGGDFDFLQRMRDTPELRSREVSAAKATVEALLNVPQPIIAAIAGTAIGAGANIALACDLVVASRDVRIADPHVKIGLVAGEGGCIWWTQSMGLHRARRHLLTGDPIDAATAYDCDLVTDLVDDPSAVLPAARALAAKIAALPPLAVQGTKRSLNHIAEIRAGEVLELGLLLEDQTLASEDLLEAIAAFKERRAGNYRGV